MWSSNDADIVTVNKNGEITTAARGEATVTAADRRNQLHKGVAMVTLGSCGIFFLSEYLFS